MHDRKAGLLMAVSLAALALSANAQTAAPQAASAPAQESAPIIPPLPVCKKPEYPEAERKAGVTGTSAIAFLIDVDGRVIDTRVVQSSGNVHLDDAARAALVVCRFYPARENGKPFRSWQTVQYVWTP